MNLWTDDNASMMEAFMASADLPAFPWGSTSTSAAAAAAAATPPPPPASRRAPAPLQPGHAAAAPAGHHRGLQGHLLAVLLRPGHRRRLPRLGRRIRRLQPRRPQFYSLRSHFICVINRYVPSISSAMCQSIIDWLEVTWGECHTKSYERRMEKKTVEEFEEFKAVKIKCYFGICAWGLGTMFFGKGVSSIEIVYKDHSAIAYLCVLVFLAQFICIAWGAAAAFFPDSAAVATLDPIDITGFGAWVAVVRAIACYHLDTYEFHPKPYRATWAFTSFCITSVLVSVYWATTAEDPRFLHQLVQFLWCLLKVIWELGRACLNIVSEWFTDRFAQLKASLGYQRIPNDPESDDSIEMGQLD